jgi:phosphohistidine phosphatase
MKELLLLRHGKSDWSTGDSDFDRPLKNRGKRNAQQMGAWLIQEALIPELILSSPANRALTTAEKLSKSMGGDVSIISQQHDIYGADVDDLLQVLSQVSEQYQRIMLVGHNPGLEDLLSYLTAQTPSPEDGKLLPTATLAHLETEQSWDSLSAHCARLISITRPKTLKTAFPYPTENGVEYRDRPAYYYTQSAVVPFRCNNNVLEIMLVRSSANKHWIIPKGIVEPGLSPMVSAEKEALEEAGVEGTSLAKSLGHYRYAKWGAHCDVDVFALEVSRVLPEEEWEENHRQRIWVSVKEAALLVKQPALPALFKTLKQRVKNTCSA